MSEGKTGITLEEMKRILEELNRLKPVFDKVMREVEKRRVELTRIKMEILEKERELRRIEERVRRRNRTSRIVRKICTDLEEIDKLVEDLKNFSTGRAEEVREFIKERYDRLLRDIVYTLENEVERVLVKQNPTIEEVIKAKVMVEDVMKALQCIHSIKNKMEF